MDESNMLQNFYAKAEDLRSMVCHLKVSEQIEAMKLLFSLLEQLQQNIVQKLTFLSGLVPQRPASSQSPLPSTEGEDGQIPVSMLPHLTSIFPSFRPETVNDNTSSNSWMVKRQNSSDMEGNAKKIRCADGNYSTSIEEASSSLDVFNLLLRKQATKDMAIENGENRPCDDVSSDLEKRVNGDFISTGRRNGTGWLIPPLMQLSMPGIENGSGSQRNFSMENDSDSRGTHSPPNIVNGSAETTPQLSPINLTMPSHLKSIGSNGLPLSPSFLPRFCMEPPMPVPSPPECIPLSVNMPSEHRSGSSAPINGQHIASITSSLQQLPSLASLFSSRFAHDSSLHLGINPMSNASFGQRLVASQTPSGDPNPAVVAQSMPFSLSQASALPPGVPGPQMGLFHPVNNHPSAALLQQIQAAIRSRRREKVNGRHFCTFPGCMENYASIEHIQDHELQHTVPDGKYLPCPVNGCRERFKWRNYLRVHMKRYHSTIVPPPLDIGLLPIRSSPRPPRSTTPQFGPSMVKMENDICEGRNMTPSNQSVPLGKSFEEGPDATAYGNHLPEFDPRHGIGLRTLAESPNGCDGMGIGNGGVARPHSEPGISPMEPLQIGSPTTRISIGDEHATAPPIVDEAKAEHSELTKMMSLGLAAIPADVRAALDGMMQLVPSSYIPHNDKVAQ